MPPLGASEGKSRHYYPHGSHLLRKPRRVLPCIPRSLHPLQSVFPPPPQLERLIRSYSEPGGELAREKKSCFLSAGFICCWCRTLKRAEEHHKGTKKRGKNRPWADGQGRASTGTLFFAKPPQVSNSKQTAGARWNCCRSAPSQNQGALRSPGPHPRVSEALCLPELA